MDLLDRSLGEGRRRHNLFRHYANRPQGRNIYRLNDGSYTENDPSDYSMVSRVYYGGHVYEVTAEEETELTAAGYGAYIT